MFKQYLFSGINMKGLEEKKGDLCVYHVVHQVSISQNFHVMGFRVAYLAVCVCVRASVTKSIVKSGIYQQQNPNKIFKKM